jgi:hypothetical protein
MPDGDRYCGADGVWSFYRHWFGSWENIQITPQRIVEVDAERVLLMLKLSGTGREAFFQPTFLTPS